MPLKLYLSTRFLANLPFKTLCRKCSSAKSSTSKEQVYPMTENSYLYISGRYGSKFHSAVSPYFNLEETKTKLQQIETSLLKRGSTSNHDLPTLIQKISALQVLQPKVQLLKEQLSQLNENQTPSESITTEYVTLRDSVWDIQETLYPELLRLPNHVEESVPTQDQLLHQPQTLPHLNFEAKSHQQISSRHNLLKFVPISPTSYFLLGRLSLLELKIGQWFSEVLRLQNFTNITCPDFVNTIIIEGTGTCPKSTTQSIILCDKQSEDLRKMHLTGTASFESLCALLTKMNFFKIEGESLKFVVHGRQYNPAFRNSPGESLYNVVQGNCVRYLVASKKDGKADEDFNSVYHILKSSYDAIGIPYRIVNVAAPNLPRSACKQVKFDLFSPYLKEFVTVGDICCYKDHVSRKLNMSYGKSNKPEDFLYIMSGVAANIPVLLGVIMEHFQREDGDFGIPEIFK